MRLFIAIELPRSFTQELARVQKEVKQVSCGGRFVPQENFHITLHFIGESNNLAGAVDAMHEAVRGIRTFTPVSYTHLSRQSSLPQAAITAASIAITGPSSIALRFFRKRRYLPFWKSGQGFSMA